MIGKKKQPDEWVANIETDPIEITRGSEMILMPRESLQGFITWAIQGDETEPYNDINISADIRNGIIFLRDQNLQLLKWPLNQLDGFLEMMHIVIEEPDTDTKFESDVETEPEEAAEESVEFPFGEPVEEISETETNTDSLAEIPKEPEIEPTSQPTTKPQILVTPKSPTIIEVVKIAYITCNCMRRIDLVSRDSYNGQAVVCPHCDSILLLFDRSER